MKLKIAKADFAILDGAVERLRPNHPALADYILEKAEGGVWQDLGSNALLFGHRPDVGSHAFDITLFPQVSSELIESFEKQTKRIIHASLRNLYLSANGCFLGSLSIYGIVRSFNREMRAPLDLAMGDLWRGSYGLCDDDTLLFASKNVSDTGQIGYFMAADGKVFGRGNGGLHAPADAGHWIDLVLWLRDQLPAQS